MGSEIELERLLNHPLDGVATSDVTLETSERRLFSPKKIKIFSMGCTCLMESRYLEITRTCMELPFSKIPPQTTCWSNNPLFPGKL